MSGSWPANVLKRVKGFEDLPVLDRLYTYQTNGVRFLDWFTAAVTGRPVEDVACRDCETPEYHWQRPKTPLRP